MTSNAIAIADTGPLYAAADERDVNHERSLTVLVRPDLHLVIPALVVAETAYLIGTRLGPSAEAAFIRGLAAFDVEPPSGSDWERMAELIERYADFPLGATDASIVALAERLKTDVIITLDQRHFSVVRPRHCSAFRLLPE